MFWLHIVAAAVIGILMFMTVIDVVRRAATGKALVGAVEITQFLMITIVFLSLAYAQVRDEHVKVDIITLRLRDRPRAWLDIVMLLIGAGFVFLVAWQGAWDTLEAFDLKEWQFGPGQMHMYTWPARLMIPIGCFFLGVQLLIDTGRRIMFLAWGRKY